jgi:hypothetical protein
MAIDESFDIGSDTRTALAPEQVEAIAAKTPAKRHDHPFGLAGGNRHIGGDAVIPIHNAGSISDGNAGILARIGENRFAATALGRGVTARVNTELSRGRTWYFAASVRNSACISFSLSGIFEARSLYSE